MDLWKDEDKKPNARQRAELNSTARLNIKPKKKTGKKSNYGRTV
jgi:hypothetical protein